MKTLDIWQIIAAAGGGAASAVFGGFDIFFQVLCILILVDFCTGYAKAIYLKKLSSNKAFLGGLKKLLIFAVIIAFAQIDRAIAGGATGLFAAQTSIPPVFRASAIVYYILGEALSILENVAAMGVQVPTGLIKRLELFSKHADEAPDNLSEVNK